MDFLKNYFQRYSVVRHQLDGFNEFVMFGIQKVVDDEPDIHVSGKVFRFTNFSFRKPSYTSCGKVLTLLPEIAREKSISYEFSVWADLLEDGKFVDRISICTIPAMVGSVACNLYRKDSMTKTRLGEIIDDLGGYFIMNGKERIITGQAKKFAYNKVVAIRNIDGDVIAEMRSYCEETAKSQPIQIKYGKTDFDLIVDNQVYKLSACLKELGHFDKVSKLLGAGERFELDEAFFILEEADLDKAKIPELSQMFPHLGNCSNLQKTVVLCKILKRLVLASSGAMSCDEIGDVGNKRIDMVGVLCQDLFKLLWKQFSKSVVKEFNKRKVGNILPVVNSKKKNISLNFEYCFSTGTWGIKKNMYKKLGVSEFSQMKVSSLTNMGLLRKISIPVSVKDKNIKFRLLHASSAFYLCPHETPEGVSVGTRLTLAASAFVSTYLSPITLIELIKELFEFEDYDGTIIYVNGFPVGSTYNCVETLNSLEQMRISGRIRRDVSIYYSPLLNFIEIWSDAGRLIRPLLKTKVNGAFLPSQEDLSKIPIKVLENSGRLVYRDPTELESLYVSESWDDKESDLTELDPCLVMGIVAGQIVFSNHTQSPRVCYMSNMIKQAIGILPSVKRRTDVAVYQLDYVQKPLNTTKMAELFGTNNQPNGINAVVAVACYTGYNQEDSIIINKSSVDRGLFNATVRRTVLTEIKNTSSFEETVCIPPEECRQYLDYSKLDETGLARTGVYVKKGDVVVGKIMCSKAGNSSKIEDNSVAIKINEEGFIESVTRYETTIKVCIIQIKIPEVGDKFCSGMAQKGTCGLMLNQEDMPFTSSGMTPDLIINPHCLPSRMTINQPMSSICSKARCLSGNPKYGDGSPFFGLTILDAACQELEMHGFSSDGTETMYNGFTGKMFTSRIFIGPVYQHRLTHLVSNKIFSSTHTNVKNKLTRQPLNGRSNDGGLRVGEMEKDCLLRHGVVRFSNERLMDLSDKYIINMCNVCKDYSHVTKISGNGLMCLKCKTIDVSPISIPYAAKLLVQELESMGLGIKIDTVE